MKKNKVTFYIYLIYFVFALLMHSILITIEQSIYVYAIDRSKSFILLIMNYVGVLLVPIFFTNLLRKTPYKKLLLFLLALAGLACLPVPLTKNLDFPKILALLIGFVYACMRISTYAFLKTIHEQERLYASIMNKLDAMFALGFVITWAIFGTLVVFNISWLSFYWGIAFLVFLLIALVARTKFDTIESTKLITPKPAQQWTVTFFALLKPQSIYASVIRFFKDLGESIWSLAGLLRYSMLFMLVICMGLLAIIQVHFIRFIPQIGGQFPNIPSVDTYLTIMTFLALFMGRILASFLLPIFSTKYLLSIFLSILICTILLLSFQIEELLLSTNVLLFNDLPSAVWLIPMMGFVWGPVMPTLNAIVLHHVEPQKAYAVAGMIIFVIFGVEVMWDGAASTLFEQFNLPIALLLAVIPTILLLIISLLFLNDLQNTNNRTTAKN